MVDASPSQEYPGRTPTPALHTHHHHHHHHHQWSTSSPSQEHRSRSTSPAASAASATPRTDTPRTPRRAAGSAAGQRSGRNPEDPDRGRHRIASITSAYAITQGHWEEKNKTRRVGPRNTRGMVKPSSSKEHSKLLRGQQRALDPLLGREVDGTVAAEDRVAADAPGAARLHAQRLPTRIGHNNGLCAPVSHSTVTAQPQHSHSTVKRRESGTTLDCVHPSALNCVHPSAFRLPNKVRTIVFL